MTMPTLRLDANEGRCLLSQEDLRAILSPEIARRYPSRSSFEVQLAEKLGVEPACMLATAGADDAIDRAARVLAGPGGLVMSTSPGFVEFMAAARRSFAAFSAVTKDPFGPFPVKQLVDAIKAHRPQLLILASPDNPSGVVLERRQLEELAETCRMYGTTFIFDATYRDFAAGGAAIADALALPGVLVTGSFSKSRGLAGFRIGYIAGSRESQPLIAALAEAGPPFSLSSPAIEAGKRALEVPEETVSGFIEEIRRETALLCSRLRALGCTVSDSQANFVLLKARDAHGLCAELAERGILVRSWPGKEGYEGLVRITLPGDAEEFSRLTAAIPFMEAYL